MSLTAAVYIHCTRNSAPHNAQQFSVHCRNIAHGCGATVEICRIHWLRMTLRSAADTCKIKKNVA